MAHPTFSNFHKTGPNTLENGKTQTGFGEPIYFSFAIPNEVKNLDGDNAVAIFIFSINFESILKEQGLNFIKPLIVGNVEKVTLKYK